MINYTYGTLCGGREFSESVVGYRFSDAIPTAAQLNLISKLMPYETTLVPLAVDFYLKLLKCSSFWSKYEPKYDPSNTYNTPVINQPTTLIIPTLYEDMVRWDTNASPTHPDFPYSKYDPLTYRVCLKLFSLLASGHPDA